MKETGKLLTKILCESSYYNIGNEVLKTLSNRHPSTQENFWWFIYLLARDYAEKHKKLGYDSRNKFAVEFAAKIAALKW